MSKTDSIDVEQLSEEGVNIFFLPKSWDTDTCREWAEGMWDALPSSVDAVALQDDEELSLDSWSEDDARRFIHQLEDFIDE